MKGIALLSALMLVASGAALAQQPGQQPGAQQPGQEQPGQPRPGQPQPGQQPGQPGQQPGEAFPGERDTDIAAADRPGTEHTLTKREQGQIRSDELVGSDVVDMAGESIGSVNELLIDEQDGSIAALLVNVGGVVGVGGRTVALTWDAVDISRTQEDGVFTDRYEVRTQMSRQQLENAPEFEDDEQDGQTFGGR